MTPNTPTPMSESAGDETIEYELNTEQCVKVALYMYYQWQEAMKPPLFRYVQFEDWLIELADVAHPEPKKEGMKDE